MSQFFMCAASLPPTSSTTKSSLSSELQIRKMKTEKAPSTSIRSGPSSLHKTDSLECVTSHLRACNFPPRSSLYHRIRKPLPYAVPLPRNLEAPLWIPIEMPHQSAPDPVCTKQAHTSILDSPPCLPPPPTPSLSTSTTKSWSPSCQNRTKMAAKISMPSRCGGRRMRVRRVCSPQRGSISPRARSPATEDGKSPRNRRTGERGTLARERKNGEWGTANAKRHSNSLNSCLTSGPHVRMDALSRSNVREGSCSRVGNRLY
jgi:hypothetical protein